MNIPRTPWVFRADLLDEHLNPCVVDADGEPVCSVDDYDDGRTHSVGVLIASAPETRAALDDAWAEARTCDDINLDQPLAGVIADLQSDRERLRGELINAGRPACSI